jgi:Chaperone of endosialidase
MGKPSAPEPPNPLTTAAASTSTNVNTAVANAFLNNTNQVTPNGSLNYNATGNYGWTDPVTGSTYNIPTFTATQTLSPQGQAIQGQTQAAQYNLAGMANAQSGRISNLLSNEMDLSGAPSAGSAQGMLGIPAAATSFGGGGPIQTQLGQAGDIANTYGPADNFSADRQRVEEALMGRINPQLDIQKQQLQQQLADQGIRYGSDAYNNAFTPYNQQANDARFAAINQAGQEQQRLVQEAGAKAAFQNTAQQQAYEQMLGSAGFANQAQAQGFQQAATQGSFANAGLAQQLQQQQAAFNASQAARNQYMQEQYATRNQPINEITSLLSGSQISQPNFLNTPSSQIPTTDVGGLINNQFQQQLGVYQQQNQNYQSLMGGILGLGAGALKGGALLSDRREKENITRMGTVFTADVDHDEPNRKLATFDVDQDERKTLPIYRYSYKDDPMSVRHIGPMAQDVEKIDSAAVTERGGVKYIDAERVMGNILRAA